MRITSKRVRKDGKFAIGITFDHGVTLQKIVTQEALTELEERAKKQREESILYHYPDKPEGQFYQHHYGYEQPEWLGDWQWSTTFGRWSRLVRFADGWEGYSYPRTF
jgi:hypothetical protein